MFPIKLTQYIVVCSGGGSVLMNRSMSIGISPGEAKTIVAKNSVNDACGCHA